MTLSLSRVLLLGLGSVKVEKLDAEFGGGLKKNMFINTIYKHLNKKGINEICITAANRSACVFQMEYLAVQTCDLKNLLFSYGSEHIDLIRQTD